jgi:hypothetical protein
MLYAFNLEVRFTSEAANHPPGCTGAFCNIWADGSDTEEAKIRALEFISHPGWELVNIEVEGDSISLRELENSPDSIRPHRECLESIRLRGVGAETFFVVPDS